MMIHKVLRPLALILALTAVSLGLTADDAPSANPTVLKFRIEGPIGPATSSHVHEGLLEAASRSAGLALVQIDTPGGLDTAMRDIIKAILASPIPVACFVSPSGARAASAGTYILYACHVSAMAPGTNLGAATPVQIGGRPNPLDTLDKQAKEKENDSAPKEERPPPPTKDAMAQKITNDAVAYIRGLAKLRGRNETWAEQAVTEAASLPAADALTEKVIDFIATDDADLLRQINGHVVSIQNQSITLNTRSALIETFEMDWRLQFLSIITNPTVAYILVLIGLYGLFFEFSNPGAMIPGVTGAIALILAMYAFHMLPVNYTGFALMILGMVLMIGEAFVPSFGALGLGGIVAFAIGSVILVDTDVPGFGVPIGLILAVSICSAVIFLLLVMLVFRATRKKVVSGREEMVGALAVADEDFTGSGSVFVHSEHWQANCSTPVKKGQSLVITDLNGLTLTVQPPSLQQQSITGNQGEDV